MGSTPIPSADFSCAILYMHPSDKLESIFRLNDRQKKALRRLGLLSVADLLYHLPTRYSQISKVKKIAELVPGERATISARISKITIRKAFRTGLPLAEAEAKDLSGKTRIIWFNQAYMAKMIREGSSVKLTGTVGKNARGTYLANPEFEKSPDAAADFHEGLFVKDGEIKIPVGVSYPIYRETRGITSKWFYHAISKILKGGVLGDIEDYLPAEILKKYNLPSLRAALFWIHRPKRARDALAARKRFAFEEVFFIQLQRQHEKLEWKRASSFRVKVEKEKIDKFIESFPFEPTSAQKKAIENILADMQKDTPMARLLEGDVGSGKTAVAAVAAHVVIKNGLQVAYMAPTEILAVQHFESFIKYFAPESGGLPLQIGLITGSGCRKFPSKLSEPAKSGIEWTDISRAQLLKWVASGEIQILVGTHSLIQKSVKFRNLALAIIDEQHRFGTFQRKKLARKSEDGRERAPHLLSMTATPIPRTLALTIYGDLDLTLLDEMPAGRKQVKTEIVLPDGREAVYEKIRRGLASGRQLYVICPRIDEPDLKKELALQAKSAVAEAKRLKKEIFPEYEVGVLHSKLSKQKKEEVMRDFLSGRTHILCATSVVEVGVNVENATSIIIEGAERFGLAQLHQLRGRVLRSTHQAYCYIFAEVKNKKTLSRLKALESAKNGFELSELDLALRGSGELSGNKQWGVSDLAMEAIKNLKMVEVARAEATSLIALDPELSHYPLLKQKVKEKAGEFHFE